MADNCHILCRDCPLIIAVNWKLNYPEKAVEIVEKWAKENPVKTYLSVLLEKLPKCRWTRKVFLYHFVLKISTGEKNGKIVIVLSKVSVRSVGIENTRRNKNELLRLLQFSPKGKRRNLRLLRLDRPCGNGKW